jgi:hypothetical protein
MQIHLSSVIPVTSLFVIIAVLSTIVILVTTPSTIPVLQILHIRISIFVFGVIIPVEVLIVTILICFILDLRVGWC